MIIKETELSSSLIFSRNTTESEYFGGMGNGGYGGMGFGGMGFGGMSYGGTSMYGLQVLLRFIAKLQCNKYRKVIC